MVSCSLRAGWFMLWGFTLDACAETGARSKIKAQLLLSKFLVQNHHHGRPAPPRPLAITPLSASSSLSSPRCPSPSSNGQAESSSMSMRKSSCESSLFGIRRFGRVAWMTARASFTVGDRHCPTSGVSSRRFPGQRCWPCR